MKSNTDQLDMQRYLSLMPLFGSLSAKELARLAQGCQLKRLTRGDMVFRLGEVCDAFYVVIVGQVKLYVSAPNGQEKVIDIIGPGHSFAEAMMFLEVPYILNCQTLSDTMLVCVSKKIVFGEIEKDSHFAMHMLAGISRRLHGLVSDVEGYALHSGMQRLIGYLLREIEDTANTNSNSNSDGKANDITVSLPVSKATIASRLSLTPEYFSRVLHELETEGLIAIDKRDVRILDVQRLANYGSH